MSNDTTLLNFIYQNAQMGLTTIPQLIAASQNDTFTQALQGQLKEYEQITSEAKQLLQKRGNNPEDISPMAKMSSFVMTEMKTMTDPSVTHMADMMVKGNTAGETALLQHLQAGNHVDSEVMKLGKKMLGTLRGNAESMKGFL